ncbi:MAG: hypothetical protein SNH35_05590 [Rikenellaceae bacterium]
MKNFTKSAIGALALCSMSVFSASAQFKPELNTGLLFHTYLQAQQEGFGSTDSDSKDYGYEAAVYRARILFETKLSEKDYFFFETDISASINQQGKTAAVRVLDAQYDHTFCDAFKLSAGKMLVSFNRNGLQTGGTLMANDFAYFQYNASGIMDNDCGRDVGINLSGSLLDKKLKYSVGAFMGHDFTSDPDVLRYIGRVQYNIIGEDNYSGTNLGEGKTLSVAAGVDNQGEYIAAGVDAFLDMPAGDAGSVTANFAYSWMTGGDSAKKYSVALPEQDVVFLELGYYFKSCKLQPWVKYELSSVRDGGMDDTVYGGGLNYFFNGYGTNVRLSYLARENSVINKSFSSVQLQLQLFIF